MKCIDYENRFQSHLDDPASNPLSSEYIAHARSCPACTRYSREMRAVDQAMRKGGQYQMRPEFRKTLETLEETFVRNYRRAQLRLDITHAILFLAPAIPLWLVSNTLPTPWEIGVKAAILFTGTVLAMRERLFYHPPGRK